MLARKLTLPLICAALLLVLLAGQVNQRGKIRIGTFRPEGTYSAYGTARREIFHKAQPDMTFAVKSTAGSSANLRLLSDQYLEPAIVQSDATFHGTGPFAELPLSGYSPVSSLYTEACQIAVRAGPGTQWTTENASLNIPLPFYPGAVRFWEEQGLAVTEGQR